MLVVLLAEARGGREGGGGGERGGEKEERENYEYGFLNCPWLPANSVRMVI